MTWLWVVLVVVVLGITATVAVGRGGAMARAYPDRRDVRLPADRPLSADDLSDVDFSVVLRGYRMDEVDDVIRRLVHEIAARDARLARLGQAGREAGYGHHAATDPASDAGIPGPPSAPGVGGPSADAYPRRPGHRATGDVLVGADPGGWHPSEPDPGLPERTGHRRDDEAAALLDPWAREPVDTPEHGQRGQQLESTYPPPHAGEVPGRHAGAGEP